MEHSSLTGKNTRKEASPDLNRDPSLQQEQRADEGPLAAQAALNALLSGAGIEQLNAGAVQALASRMGNSALLELLAGRQTGPQLVQGLPLSQPVTQTLSSSPGQPQLEAAPEMGQMNFPAGSPLEV